MSKKNNGAKKKHKDSATVASNRKAHFDYHLGKEIVAGMVLQGTEVKSVRAGNVQLRNAYAKIIDDEIFLFNCVIAEYKHGNRHNHDPDRAKKLLLKKYEIERLAHEMQLKNLTLVASKVFFKRNYAKCLLHLAEGKKKGDKRESLKKRDQQRDINRALSQRY
jgi:SsrA-binding protein